MKKTTSFWLTVAACLVLIGGAGFCLTMAVNHWDFSLLDGKKAEIKTFEVKERFQSISIDSSTEDIELCPSKDGNCRVVCYEREKEKHTVSVQNGTLWIDQNDSRKWYDNILVFSFETPTITVYLPQSEYDLLSVEDNTGSITIPKDFTFGSMEMKLSTGHVKCLASSRGPICITSNTGDICLQGLSAGELDLTVSTGHVDVQSVSCKGDVGVTAGTGGTQLTDVTCKNISSTVSTGDITLKNVIAAETLNVESSTGDLRLEQCDADELEIETNTGNVTGSLLSDKIFIARSSTGDIDVPESVSGGKCKISTSTGDITMTVAD